MIEIDGRIPAESFDLQQLLREMADDLNALKRESVEGFGTPEGAVVGRKGRMYRRLDGGAGTCLYVFEGTDGAVTGWVAK